MGCSVRQSRSWTIQKQRAAGADTVHLAFPAASRHDDMRRFAEEVLPQARKL
jgi:hypothetical protein